VAVEAAVVFMRSPVTLEFDMGNGTAWRRYPLCELTGAEDAAAVDHNGAAALLALNTLGTGREAIVSRGELIEIRGAFRIPDIMASAGVKLKEVGTTNRTHLHDYEGAIGPKTGLILEVHPSNYHVEGFTKTIHASRLYRQAA
jgi:L-seryl-tRNA(Ser) seleniumtransferase